jgi:uncharacterized protein (DUF1778 family)
MAERKDNYPVQVRLTEQERELLKEAADRLGVYQSDLVRIALNNLFEQYRIKKRLQMRQTSKPIPHVI